jgi:hypothetical protein
VKGLKLTAVTTTAQGEGTAADTCDYHSMKYRDYSRHQGLIQHKVKGMQLTAVTSTAQGEGTATDSSD